MPAADAKSKAPNFYESAASMGAMPGGAKPDDADKGKKSENVAALLQVVQRIDSMEKDPDLKQLTQQIVSMTQQYMDKLQGGGKGPAGSAPPPAPTADGAAAGAAAAGGPGAGGPVPA